MSYFYARAKERAAEPYGGLATAEGAKAAAAVDERRVPPRRAQAADPRGGADHARRRRRGVRALARRRATSRPSGRWSAGSSRSASRDGQFDECDLTLRDLELHPRGVRRAAAGHVPHADRLPAEHGRGAGVAAGRRPAAGGAPRRRHAWRRRRPSDAELRGQDRSPTRSARATAARDRALDPARADRGRSPPANTSRPTGASRSSPIVVSVASRRRRAKPGAPRERVGVPVVTAVRHDLGVGRRRPGPRPSTASRSVPSSGVARRSRRASCASSPTGAQRDDRLERGAPADRREPGRHAPGDREDLRRVAGVAPRRGAPPCRRSAAGRTRRRRQTLSGRVTTTAAA